MASFLAPPAYKPERTDARVDDDYKGLRWQVFIGIFIGYAGFYLVRKNLSMAVAPLGELGFNEAELGGAMAMNALAYGISKFVMASISDRSNARRFLPLGLILSAIAMLFMIVPVVAIGPENKGLAITLMGVFNFLVGWFQGMGWPPCGRVMTRWFSIKERGTWMSVWNCAHNVGGALVGPMAGYGALWFGHWFFGENKDLYFLIGTYAFPAAVAILIAILAYVLIRDTPQSCGLPSIEKWSGSASKNYDAKKSEQSLSVKEIFRTVLSNKFLWYIALANSFIYMVRYGCLDWAPKILDTQGADLKSAGWAYFAFEFAAIPGTIFCGWLSDKVFNGRRAMPTMLFMAVIIAVIVVYWQFINNFWVVVGCLIAIGFLIYGPVMLIGVQALDLAPKNAAGTAAGLTGFMGYVLGTSILANTVLGYVLKLAKTATGYNFSTYFLLLIAACVLAIFFMGLTFKEEQYLVADRKGESIEKK